MATLSVQSPTTSGIALSFGSAASGGDQFLNDGKSILLVKNGDSSAKTVTVAGQRTCNQGSTHNAAVSVAAGAQEAIGPFNPAFFNDPNGYVQVTYSAVTSVTVAVVKVSL